MMETPLDAWVMFAHAERHFGDVEIVTGAAGGGRHRYTYADFAGRAQQLMHALDWLGVETGGVVATLAWNHHHHLEAYFGVPCSGRVLHTLNLRLSPDELGYVIGHAGDEVILVDADLVPLLESVADTGALAKVRHTVVFGDASSTSLPGVVAYDDLLADQRSVYPRREIPERSPFGICYTSGTTGRSKGVLYTHRSTVLHAMGVASGAAFAIGPSDCVLPVVPMFHANAWGVPYAATMVGAKQVFAAGPLDAPLLVELLTSERVTVSAGVPTVWLEVADELRARGARPSDLRHIVCGGSQPPQALIAAYRDTFGVPILQAWGMTETSPLASVAWPKHHMRDYDDERVLVEAANQAGLPLPGIELQINESGGASQLPWDGTAMGSLMVRGLWVTDGYLHGEGAGQFHDGWFATGDVAVGSPNGYFRIADRTKDLIKSGGEWISSVDMEAALMALPEVVEAAVVAIPDPKWQERPLACVVPLEGKTLTLQQAREHLLAAGFAKWQLPDRLEVLDEIPRTSVGKFDKKALRARLGAADDQVT